MRSGIELGNIKTQFAIFLRVNPALSKSSSYLRNESYSWKASLFVGKQTRLRL